MLYAHLFSGRAKFANLSMFQKFKDRVGQRDIIKQVVADLAVCKTRQTDVETNLRQKTCGDCLDMVGDYDGCRVMVVGDDGRRLRELSKRCFPGIVDVLLVFQLDMPTTSCSHFCGSVFSCRFDLLGKGTVGQQCLPAGHQTKRRMT